MTNTTENLLTIGSWIKATFWGWLLGVVLILLLSSILDSIGIEHMQFYLGVGMGAGVGFAQWLVLKKVSSIGFNWVWFSIIGMGIPFIIFDWMPSGIITHKLPPSVALGALTVGILQSILLKRQSPKAYLWIAGCSIGWILGVAIVFTIDYTMQLKPFIASNLILALINLLLILSCGIVLGATTALTMKKILE
jgi:hypothetical protein